MIGTSWKAAMKHIVETLPVFKEMLYTIIPYTMTKAMMAVKITF